MTHVINKDHESPPETIKSLLSVYSVTNAVTTHKHSPHMPHQRPYRTPNTVSSRPTFKNCVMALIILAKQFD